MAIKSELEKQTKWDFFGKKKTVFVPAVTPINETLGVKSDEWQTYKGPKFGGVTPSEIPVLALYQDTARLNSAAQELIQEYEVTHVQVAVSPCKTKLKIMPVTPDTKGALKTSRGTKSKYSMSFSMQGAIKEFGIEGLVGKRGTITLCDDGLIADFSESQSSL